ncbi:MAG TPA: hypothetical protein VFQ26_08165 [Nitrospiraceae bacterium]|nr:hypothetical protein [Nitrospiraceae bacterium]
MIAQHKADEIRRRMAAVRSELDEEVESIPASVKALTSWRNIVRAYPWECVATAAFFGYVLVLPRRTLKVIPPEAEAWVRSAAANKSSESARRSRPSWAVQGLSWLGHLAMRSATAYASREIARLVADRTDKPDHMGVSP